MGIKFGAHFLGFGSDLLQAQNEPSAIQFVIAVIGIVVGTMGSGLRLLAEGMNVYQVRAIGSCRDAPT
jgi:hypothetical protein